jgi:hypothetical protein
MTRIALAVAVVLGMGIAGAQAQTPGLALAEELLSGQFPAAIGPADEMLVAAAEPEDEVDREWLAALGYMRGNAPRAALPHLERLVTMSPETARFRLELARALYLIEDDARAYFHFEQALGGNLSLAEIATVNEYLRAMEQRKPWQGHARIALVRQSNPWYRSGEEFVDIGGKLQLPLPPVERSVGVELGLGFTYLPTIRPDLHGRVHLFATGQVFEESDLNRWHLRGEFGLLAMGDYSQQISGGLTLQGAFGTDGRIMHGVGIYGVFQRRYANRLHLGFRINADSLQYKGIPTLDGLRVTAGVEGTYLYSPRLRLHGGLSIAHAQTEAAFHRRTTGSVNFGGQFAFAGGTIGGLDAKLSHSRVSEANPLQLQYGPERSNRVDLTAQLMHREFTIRDFAPVLVLGYTYQRSNVPTQGFSNFKLTMGATRNF